MQTPWFLEALALGADADAPSVRQAYAARLKAIDPATDPEGFARLREAYERARDWLSRPGQAPECSCEDEAGTVSPTEANAHGTGERPTALAALAAQWLEQLGQRIQAAEPPDLDAEFDACTRDLRQHHLDAPFLFECLLVEALANQQLGHRLAVFTAASARFGWGEFAHLSSLGRGGAWIDAVERERHAFAGIDPARREHVLHWLSYYGDNDTPIPAPGARAWPPIHDALAQYPRFLGLYISGSRAAAWNRRHEEVAGVAHRLAMGNAGRAQHDAAHRAMHAPVGNRQSRARRNASITCVMFFFFATWIAGLTRRAEPEPADAMARHVPGTSAAERSRASACMQTVDEIKSLLTQPTDEQLTQLRECRLLLDRLQRAEAAPRQAAPTY
ncbi:hypothetical protein ABIE56_002058 [Luteibacter sp. 621]|uniref:hypothetical protein n=1 Tax=Luteibacter sp. 621 TaxID=3373916 RepID=UPI003D20DE2B